MEKEKFEKFEEEDIIFPPLGDDEFADREEPSQFVVNLFREFPELKSPNIKSYCRFRSELGVEDPKLGINDVYVVINDEKYLVRQIFLVYGYTGCDVLIYYKDLTLNRWYKDIIVYDWATNEEYTLRSFVDLCKLYKAIDTYYDRSLRKPSLAMPLEEYRHESRMSHLDERAYDDYPYMDELDPIFLELFDFNSARFGTSGAY